MARGRKRDKFNVQILFVILIAVVLILVGIFSSTGLIVSNGVCEDADGDGYFDEENCGTLVDCDDKIPFTNPGANEFCTDEKDNDCDGFSDSRDCDCIAIDNDNDGYYVNISLDKSLLFIQKCEPDVNDSDPTIGSLFNIGGSD
jgi:hypothetical protein